MGCTANIIIKDIIDIFASICKNIRILLMGRHYQECCDVYKQWTWSCFLFQYSPDSKVHGANMGLTWGRQDPGGPHVGPMNLAMWGTLYNLT